MDCTVLHDRVIGDIFFPYRALQVQVYSVPELSFQQELMITFHCRKDFRNYQLELGNPLGQILPVDMCEIIVVFGDTQQ